MESLRKQFFSKENIRKIQDKIKKKIYVKTNGKIKLTVDQDELDLLIVMKNIYNKEAGEELLTIEKLNKLVLKNIIPDMLLNINHSAFNDIDKISKPLPRPINVNKISKKPLPSTTTLF